MLGAIENIIKFFNKILKRNNTPMIANVTKQNYDKYCKTYDTLSKISSVLDGIDVYFIGGISAALQTNQDLYRQNNDIDIMCKEGDLFRIIEILQKIGYSVEDRRGIKTRNRIDLQGNFQTKDHELNANIRNRNMLNVGIFTYQVKDNKVITRVDAFEEKEGRVIGTEKVMHKELFDLMYDSEIIDYKGIKLKTLSKEYSYMNKSRGTREKDKLDAKVLESTIDDKSKTKIAKIKELEAKIRSYRIFYNKDGEIESKTKLHTLEEKVNFYLDSLFMKDITKTPEEIVADVLQSDRYNVILDSYPGIDSPIEAWKEKVKNYTYQDKIELLTKNYSRRLKGLSRETVDSALGFLQGGHTNRGENYNDSELSNEEKEVFMLMREYEQAIKKIFADNNIDTTNITKVVEEVTKLLYSYTILRNVQSQNVGVKDNAREDAIEKNSDMNVKNTNRETQTKGTTLLDNEMVD